MTERVYISGPMRGYLDYNFPAFYRAEEVIREVYPDAEVFSPARRDADKYEHEWGEEDGSATWTAHDIGRWLFDSEGEDFDIREAMAADLDYIVRRATVVVSLPGITRSSGYQAEAAAARSVGVPVRPVEEFLADAGYDSRIKPADEALWNVRPYDNPAHESLVADTVLPEFIATGETHGAFAEFLRQTEGHAAPRCDHSGRTVLEMVADVLDSGTVNVPLTPLTVAEMLDRDHPDWRSSTAEGGTVTYDVAEPLFANSDGPCVGNDELAEVRSVSRTGGEKGTKLARYDLIPTEPLRLLAEHFGRGARKYDDHNWRRGYEWSKSFSALCRHLWAFWGGEDIDEETGSPHMVAVAWHAFVLLDYMQNHPEFDDRFEAQG